MKPTKPQLILIAATTILLPLGAFAGYISSNQMTTGNAASTTTSRQMSCAEIREANAHQGDTLAVIAMPARCKTSNNHQSSTTHTSHTNSSLKAYCESEIAQVNYANAHQGATVAVMSVPSECTKYETK